MTYRPMYPRRRLADEPLFPERKLREWWRRWQQKVDETDEERGEVEEEFIEDDAPDSEDHNHERSRATYPAGSAPFFSTVNDTFLED